jgi:GTPase
VEGTGVEPLKQLLHGLPIPSVSNIYSCLPSSNSLCGSLTRRTQETTGGPVTSPCEGLSGGSGGGVEVLLDGVLQVPRVGTVVCGFVAKGVVHLHDTLLIGPDRKGLFHPVGVEGIHVKGSHVTYATAGLEVTIAIRHMSDSLLDGTANMSLNRKGNVLIDQSSSPTVCVAFDMEIVQILAHAAPSTGGSLSSVRTVTAQQEPIVHTRNIRQAARIISCWPQEAIPYEESVGATLHCKFLYNAEVMDIGATVLLRWNHDAKLMGVVTNVHPMTPTTSPALRPEAFPSLMMDDGEEDM